MEKFNESLPFDKRMWLEDIRVRLDKKCSTLNNNYVDYQWNGYASPIERIFRTTLSIYSGCC